MSKISGTSTARTLSHPHDWALSVFTSRRSLTQGSLPFPASPVAPQKPRHPPLWARPAAPRPGPHRAAHHPRTPRRRRAASPWSARAWRSAGLPGRYRQHRRSPGEATGPAPLRLAWPCRAPARRPPNAGAGSGGGRGRFPSRRCPRGPCWRGAVAAAFPRGAALGGRVGHIKSLFFPYLRRGNGVISPALRVWGRMEVCAPTGLSVSGAGPLVLVQHKARGMLHSWLIKKKKKNACPRSQRYVGTKIVRKERKNEVPLLFWSLCGGVPAADPPLPPHPTSPRGQEILIHHLLQIFPLGSLFWLPSHC